MNGGRTLTPSAFFSKYCAHVRKYGNFLCDAAHHQPRGLQSSTGGGTFDIENALAAASGSYSDVVVDSPPVEDNVPVDEPQQPSFATGSNVANGMGQSLPAAFPLVMGGWLILASVAFTAYTLFIVFGKWKENRNSTEDTDIEEELMSIEEDKMREENMLEIRRHNSWVLGESVHDGNIEQLDNISLVEEGEEKAMMAWKNLSCSYPSKKSGEGNITTLSGVTGHIQHKELVAIMGGSGGGKSTLMDILSGRKSLGKLSGEMSVLGESMAPKDSDCQEVLRDIAAYVPQKEQFFPNQTPEEAVGFVANLKLGRDKRGDDIRKRRIDQILDLVGIPKAARKRAIGGTLAGGVVIRGLSGGECKRLALACAIAMKPKLLFLDEITSGLDSENAVMVIELVKKLCVNMNVAAIIVIHQPSYEIFSHFDRLVLLSEGKCVYADKLNAIPSFYDSIGRRLPQNFLIPNDILRAASGCTKSGCSSMFEPNVLVETHGKNLLKDIKKRTKPSMIFKVKTVLLRQMMNHYVRNHTNLLARLLIYGLTAVLLGAIFWKIAETEDGEPLSFDQAKAAFGAGNFFTQIYYLLPFCQISTFFFDKSLFASESSIGLYPAWIYSLCQITLEAWVMTLSVLVQVSIALPMMGFWNPSMSKLESFVTMFAVFCIDGIVGNAIVLLTSLIAFSQDLAFLVGAANVIVFLAVSGGFVPFPYIEDWIVWLQWVSPIKYSFQAFTWSLLSNTPTTALLEFLELDTPAGVSSNIAILIGIFILCAGGSVIALSKQREVR